jgi:hypothetical protein
VGENNLKFEAVQRPPTIHELAQKILLLSMMICEETKHVAFCNYFGHVQKLDIRIFVGGWHYQDDCIKYEIWLGSEEDETFVKTLLGEVLDTLERIYKEGTQCADSPVPDVVAQ